MNEWSRFGLICLISIGGTIVIAGLGVLGCYCAHLIARRAEYKRQRLGC